MILTKGHSPNAHVSLSKLYRTYLNKSRDQEQQYLVTRLTYRYHTNRLH